MSNITGPVGEPTGGSQWGTFEQPAATPGFTQVAAAQASMGTRSARRSLYQSNQLSFTAMGVVVLYFVVAFATHFVLLGIFPAILAFRAFGRGEKLAPLAAVAAALAVASFVLLTQG